MALPTLVTLSQRQVGGLPRHPLEPLTAEEVRSAVALLKEAGKVNATTRFVSVALKEMRSTPPGMMEAPSCTGCIGGGAGVGVAGAGMPPSV